MIKVSICSHYVCLPDYWSGTAKPFLCVPVSPQQTAEDITKSLKNEFSTDGFYGREDMEFSDEDGNKRKLTDNEKDELNVIVHQELESLFTIPLSTINPFDLEGDTDEDGEPIDGIDSVYLYLTFDIEITEGE